MATEAISAPQVNRSEWAIVSCVTAAFTVALTLWALLTPMFQAPDEVVHFDAAVRVAEGDSWPAPGEALFRAASLAAQDSITTVPTADRPSWADLEAAHPGTTTDVNQMTQHPPTYYLLAGTVLDTIDFTQHRWDAGVLALRLLDVVLVAPLPLLTWATVRRLTRSPRTALVAATALFAVPQLAQIGASVTNDAPVILLGGVVVWLTTRVLTGDRTWRTTLVLGAALGLMLAVKGTAFPAVPFVALAVLLGGTSTVPLRTRLLQTLGTGVVTAALGAWWWIGNLVRYGTIQPNGLPRSFTPNPWPEGEGPNAGAFVNTEWNRLSASFWGQFGRLEFAMTPILTDLLTVSCLLFVVWSAFRPGPRRRIAWVLASFPLLTLLVLLQNNWSSYERTQEISGAQGRYFFGALVALVALAALGALTAIGSPVTRRRLARVVLVASPVIGAYGFSVAYRGFFEGTDLEITGLGVSNLLVTTPAGGGVFTVLVVLLAVTALASVVGTWRTVSPVGKEPRA
jgi:4-amino-4-deoxy-L-arabinose transferase-like glycosyltransferase